MSTFGILNIVSQPHPEGIYERLLTELGERRVAVKFYGEQYASISPVTTPKDGLLAGRIATWVEPDRTAKTINLESLEQQVFNESGVVIPRGIGLNSRVFEFIFDVKRHRMVLSLRNDEGQTISITRLATIMMRALAVIAEDYVEEVLVTVVTKDDAIETILGLPEIRKVEIDIFRPNPDDFSDDEEEILKEMEEERIKRKKTTRTKAKKADTISLSARTRAEANVAKDNGSVSVSGVDENGEKQSLSTKELPKIVYWESDQPTQQGRLIEYILSPEFEDDDDGAVIDDG